jgi:hypothetical protein
MLTTADLPAALRLDPAAPHVCGHASCREPEDSARGNAPSTGVASQG